MYTYPLCRTVFVFFTFFFSLKVQKHKTCSADRGRCIPKRQFTCMFQLNITLQFNVVPLAAEADIKLGWHNWLQGDFFFVPLFNKTKLANCINL